MTTYSVKFLSSYRGGDDYLVTGPDGPLGRVGLDRNTHAVLREPLNPDSDAVRKAAVEAVYAFVRREAEAAVERLQARGYPVSESDRQACRAGLQ